MTTDLIAPILSPLLPNPTNGKPAGRIAYLGPEGSFTQQAAINWFGYPGNYLVLDSIRDVFESVETGKALYGVVPIENNQEGTVLDTIDLLYEKEVQIVAETEIAIQFVLATCASNLTDITHIYSKDIAFRQCSAFLRNQLAGLPVEQVAIESTSKAAQLASKNQKTAALCSPMAAKQHRIPILFDCIGNSPLNRTRFLLVMKNYQNPKSGADKTTIIVHLPNTDSPGILANFLQEFGVQKINLTKIESRPLRQGANFRYWFLVEFDGHFDDESVQEIVRHHPAEIKWLGSYRNTTN